MLVLPGKIHDLRHLGFRDLECVDTALANTMHVYMHHDLRRRIPVLLKKALQNMDHKFHRCVIVVQQ
jgi:hypothetical protein